MPYPLGNGHPRFWAWVCSPPNVMAVFGEALAAAMNPHCDVGNHAASHLERQVTGWFAEMVGFPESAKGILVSGGSMANLTGLTVARHAKAGFDVRRDGLQRTERPLVAYVSAEGHSCLRKAFELLGIGAAQVRPISTDDAFRMRVSDLETQIVVDLAEGNRPFVVVANAGATNTGAIDPLRDISAIAKRHGLWMHVDGAYGAPAILASEYREQLSGLALADSIAIDPHKWLQVPVEAGLALVKDAELMRDAFSLVPPYLRQDGREDGVEGPVSYAEYGFQQTRGFRALKIWMMVKHLGMDRIAAMIEQNIELARLLEERVRRTPDLELVAPRSLSVVDFRYAPSAFKDDREALNALNKALVERIQLGGEAFLAGTLVRGAYCIRACIVNYLARPSDVDVVVDVIRREADALLPQFLAEAARMPDVRRGGTFHGPRRGVGRCTGLERIQVAARTLQRRMPDAPRYRSMSRDDRPGP